MRKRASVASGFHFVLSLSRATATQIPGAGGQAPQPQTEHIPANQVP